MSSAYVVCWIFLQTFQTLFFFFFFFFFFAYRQIVWTLIRLFLEEQSDMGSHGLQKWPLKSQADDKADDNCCDWQFKG